MGRRSSSSSSSSGSAGAKKKRSSPSASASFHSSSRNLSKQLEMLRNFVGTGANSKWSEADLTDCLRSCGYNVERAAECLITGSYKSRRNAGGGNGGGGRNMSFFHTMGQPKSSSSSTVMAAAAETAVRPAAAKKIKSNDPRNKEKTSSSSSSSSHWSNSKTSKQRRTPSFTTSSSSSSLKPAPPPASKPPSSSRVPSWLLCQRWISQAVCMTRDGRTGYREKFALEHTKTGPPCVRFRGRNIEGRLPDNLAALLAPLLRYDPSLDDEVDRTKKGGGVPPSSSPPPLIRLGGEALMQENRIAIGSDVPMSIRVYVESPRGFFQLFERESSETSLNMFFDNNNRAGSSGDDKEQRKGGGHRSRGKKNRLPIAEAAFGLLQWAEYGDVLEFSTPPASADDAKDDGGTQQMSDAGVDEDAEDDGDDEEEEEGSGGGEATTEEAKRLESSVTANSDWATSLPEADDPVDLADGIALRPYQRQALYWMLKREREGESREELERQLELLSELATNESKKGSSNSSAASGFRGKGNNDGIFCDDCGPVVVSEEAKKRSKTADGQVDPPKHPLWKQRFLASPDMKETLSFYVNELIGVATHRAVAPPTPCNGGVLADCMGLGKTVMLLSLILKSKEAVDTSSENAPRTTLVVAKLSLLPQWEDEIKTKTPLTYLVYYGQQGKTTPTAEEIGAVDVVITTYGTIQAEGKKKNPVLLNFRWLRVILDEAHCVRNENTLASKVCSKLIANHRWCATGTVIQNSLNDVFGIMKFLRHEPWCFSPFWKAAISRPMATGSTGDTEEDRQEGLNIALDRVRRLLCPLMLRRTKDTLTKDGNPILSLPPVEVKIIKVNLSNSEREFYNAVLDKSLALFDGYVEAGTLSKSYFQVFSLLQRLRQVCDHIGLTVNSRMNADGANQAQLQDKVVDLEEEVPKEDEGSEDAALGKRFLDGLLEKFFVQQSSPKKSKNRDEEERNGEEPPAKKRSMENLFLSQQAHSLSQAVQSHSEYVEEECPICLELPKIKEAVLAPCGHGFCRPCLLSFLRERGNDATVKSENMSQNSKNSSTNSHNNVNDCPDGVCPCCDKIIKAKHIIAVESKDESGIVTTTFLPDLKASPAASSTAARKPTDYNAAIAEGTHVPAKRVARQELENAVSGSASSKMKAIMNELTKTWEVDPGSKVLLFSHYLGFLDLLAMQLERRGIEYFRLDGTLDLKARMNVLERFRSSADNRPRAAAAKKNACVNENPLSGEETNKKGQVLLMSMTAGGEGLNLVAASSVFICDPWWNEAKEDQCVNRIHRIGQTAAKVRVRKFVVEDSVEERIVELQGRKKHMADSIYNGDGSDDAAAGGGAKLSLDDFKLIFRK